MKQIISIDFYFENLEHIPLIDVRSPEENLDTFQMPNLELFSDEERAVGTAYKKEVKERAIEIGFEYVKPKLNDFSLNLLQLHLTKKIHCWRGMRSNALPIILSKMVLKSLCY
jgi:tRNA 2-selenouridine synthase